MITPRDASRAVPPLALTLTDAEPVDSARAREAQQEYDALADLFLSDAAIAAVPSARPRGPASPAATATSNAPLRAPGHVAHTGDTLRIEGLVLGHLPVLGAAWVTQYARHLAEESRQGVALLRLQSGQVWLDLVPSSPSHAPTPQAPSISGGNISLEDAITTAGRWTRQWIVRVDEPFEPDLLRNPQLSCTTLLTGADDAAVVASYRTIKAMSPDSQADEDDDSSIDAQFDDSAGPHMKLVIMGADDQKAASAEHKLQRAVRTFLGREVEPAARIRKINPCASVALFRGRVTADINDLLSLIAAASRPAPAPRMAAEAPAPARPAATSAAPHRPEPTTQASTPTTTQPIAQTSTLASRMPGMRHLALACPYAAAVQFAADQQGGLHLLAAAGQGLAPTDLSVGDGVRQLLTAASWAQDHAALLAAAHPDLALDDAGPALHLLTDNARAARGLLDTGVRVHLLAGVEIEGKTAWVCRELN